MTLRLGVIGLSPGNGHPYSWSAIFNGYDLKKMEICGFPVIPRYLEDRSFPDDCIPEAKVTHVWAQDPETTTKIAEAALIPNKVSRYQDMIGEVDAVLLARDDAEKHREIAEPFLAAGLPIFIDKPLALSVCEARRLLDMQAFAGQIFSCSALRYSPDMILDADTRAALGKICHVHAITPKLWAKYSMHIIDPMLNLLGYAPPEDLRVNHIGAATLVTACHLSGASVTLGALGDAAFPIRMTVVGTNGTRDLQFFDSFVAFRAALQAFVDGLRAREERTTHKELITAVSWLEGGLSV